MIVTTLDVLDNFMSGRDEQDFARMPGAAIHELGELVRQFVSSQTVQVDPDRHPVYIGGWPSANFWSITGELILSSLLYSGQVLVRDPLADWFSDEQYQLPHLLASRPGYFSLTTDELNMSATRAFLANLMPGLSRMRPLIEAGIVVLVPGERTFLSERSLVEGMVTSLKNKLVGDPLGYSARFPAADIATEANVRGMFVFAGGEHASQIATSIETGLRFFAREKVLAETFGATYTAPFEHERFLCVEGIQNIQPPSTRVAQTILRSNLPVFAGLTPKLIRDIHDDSNFAGFRSELHQMYSAAPIESSLEELNAYIWDQEQTILKPLLEAAQKDVERGLLGRLGASLTQGKFGLTSGIAVSVATGSPALATAATAFGAVADLALGARRSRGTRTIWNALVRHKKGASDEIPSQQTGGTAGVRGWEIPDKPSMSVTVSPGALINDFSFVAGQAPLLPKTGDCRCGSGLLAKACCGGLTSYRPGFLS